jgi:hypothetical protein
MALERLDTFLFSITYEQFFEEVNLIRRTERSNEHSTTSGLSGLAVYEWPETTEAILVRAVAPTRCGPDVVGGQRLSSAADRGVAKLIGTGANHTWHTLWVVKTIGFRVRCDSAIERP